MEITATIVKTPMMIPNNVRNVLSLFVQNELSAIPADSPNWILATSVFPLSLIFYIILDFYKNTGNMPRLEREDFLRFEIRPEGIDMRGSRDKNGGRMKAVVLNGLASVECGYDFLARCSSFS